MTYFNVSPIILEYLIVACDLTLVLIDLFNFLVMGTKLCLSLDLQHLLDPTNKNTKEKIKKVTSKQIRT